MSACCGLLPPCPCRRAIVPSSLSSSARLGGSCFNLASTSSRPRPALGSLESLLYTLCCGDFYKLSRGSSLLNFATFSFTARVKLPQRPGHHQRCNPGRNLCGPWRLLVRRAHCLLCRLQLDRRDRGGMSKARKLQTFDPVGEAKLCLARKVPTGPRPGG